MAGHLLRKHGKLWVLGHRRKEPLERLSSQGATVAASAEEMGKNTDVVFLMLPSSQESWEVCFGKNGLIHHVKPGTCIVDCTTGSPEKAQEMNHRFLEKKCAYLDAPVTGGKKGAEDGTLTIMVGGDESIFRKMLPLLESFGKSIHFMGPSGRGLEAKLVNNYVCLANLVVLSEGLSWAKQLGLDQRIVLQILKTGTGGSRQLDLYGDSILSRDFTPRFKCAHGLKDLRLAENLGQKMHSQPILLEQVRELYEKAETLGDNNVSIVIEAVEEMMGKSSV